MPRCGQGVKRSVSARRAPTCGATPCADGTRFEARLNPATAAEVRLWQQAHGIGPAQRCAARALHALVDRLAEMVGAQAVLGACARLLSLAEGAA